MGSVTLKPLSIGDKIAPLPIVQGGMGVGISLSRLASAVANAGGIGVIAAAGIGMNEADFYSDYRASNIRALRQEIRKAKELTQGLLGLNIMVATTNYDDLIRVAVEEQIDFVFSGAGLPMTMPEYLVGNSSTKMVPIVSSARAANVICRRWLHRYDYLPDAVVVEGPKAGGHLGFSREQILDPAFSLERLLPEVLQVVEGYANQYGKPIPVIGAGGIFTGADIRKMLGLGIQGVQMGTRFVATHECDADDLFKQAYVDASAEDVVIIDSPVGMPGRALSNRYLDEVARGVKQPYKCPYHCIATCDIKNSPYCIAHALISAKRGRFRNGFAFAGANVYRVREITSVKELVATLVTEFEQAAHEKVA